MKRILASLATLAFLAVSVPALAQDRDNHDHGGPAMEHHGQAMEHGGPAMQHRYAPPPRRHVYREGQVYNGHHLTNRGGHWGYYQPRNGVNVFINIPL